MAKRSKKTLIDPQCEPGYDDLVSGISDLLERARRTAARSINSIMTVTYWEVGRRIVEFEQEGKARAEYGAALLKALAHDLTAKHGRGFSRTNVQQMRLFYLGWEICQTPSGKLEARAILPAELVSRREICQTPSGKCFHERGLADGLESATRQSLSAESPLALAKRHLMMPDEADPIGIILCAEKDDAVVEYATGDIRAKVFASKYLTNLPDKETLRQEILKTQRALLARSAAKIQDD